MRRSFATLLLCLLVSTCGPFMPVAAQHNHHRHHNDYRDWSSQKRSNCCNNDDCGTLKADEWRHSRAGVEVLIAKKWCPVLREHFLTRGKSPDWNVAHACVQKPMADENSGEIYDPDPCQRLLCFSGTGGI